MAKNPYTLLGVKKSATDKEVQSAYRKLAKKYHPDVNQGDAKAEERFKEVTAAYNLLSDKTLRKQYDTGQVDESGQQQNPFGGGFRQTAGGSPFGGMGGGQDDMAELFSSLFGMNMGGRRGGMNRPPMRPQKGADIRYRVKLSLPDALKGGSRTLDQGLKVKIPVGIKDGQVLRLRGKGQAGQYGGPSGDAKIEVEVLTHKNLERSGDNLHLTLPISLHEAMHGAKVKVDMPNGAVQLSIPAGTNSSKKFRLKGKGIGKGHLVVTPIITLTEGELANSDTFAGDIPQSDGADLREKLI